MVQSVYVETVLQYELCISSIVYIYLHFLSFTVTFHVQEFAKLIIFVITIISIIAIILLWSGDIVRKENDKYTKTW
jgi:hypothetical protein